MKIIQLTAENFKRLTAVEITPDGNTVVLTGKNGAGKTSILDAIWAVLSNPRSSQIPKPIRDGADKATITVKLDERDLIITRVFTKGGTRLEVMSKDGAVFKSPQALLDKFLGALSFDPLAFMQLSDKEQTNLLLDIVPLEIDLEALATERAALYDERRVVNRTLSEAKAQLPFNPPPKVNKVSVSELVNQLNKAQEQRAAFNVLVNDIDIAKGAKQDNLEKIAMLQQQNKVLDEQIAKRESELESMDMLNVEPIKAALADAEHINQQAADYEHYLECKQNYEKRLSESKAYTDKINAIDEKRAKAISHAKFPIEGLGFGDAGVTYNGIPIKQISDAEQLRVSLAIAMALNPELRVIRIRNGSLLDSNNMAIIEKMAEDKDFQIWVERVDESGEIGIVIEDGQVKE